MVQPLTRAQLYTLAVVQFFRDNLVGGADSTPVTPLTDYPAALFGLAPSPSASSGMAPIGV
jgi:hypothetical protein